MKSNHQLHLLAVTYQLHSCLDLLSLIKMTIRYTLPTFFSISFILTSMNNVYLTFGFWGFKVLNIKDWEAKCTEKSSFYIVVACLMLKPYMSFKIFFLRLKKKKMDSLQAIEMRRLRCVREVWKFARRRELRRIKHGRPWMCWSSSSWVVEMFWCRVRNKQMKITLAIWCDIPCTSPTADSSCFQPKVFILWRDFSLKPGD